MTSYTIHDPGTHMKIAEYKRLPNAFKAAYRMLPLVPDQGGVGKDGRWHMMTEGRYVVVQEWDAEFTPLRQWCISGQAAA